MYWVQGGTVLPCRTRRDDGMAQTASGGRVKMNHKISCEHERRFFCYNCKSHYTEKEIIYNGWVSKYCPMCFRLQESPSDCKLMEEI